MQCLFAMPGHLQQVFQELLATISRRIVQPAVARAVHGIGVGPAVQQELHHSNAVGTNGIAQGGDALGSRDFKTVGQEMVIDVLGGFFKMFLI